MNPTTLAVILLVVGAFLFLIVEDWFGGDIASANPFKSLPKATAN